MTTKTCPCGQIKPGTTIHKTAQDYMDCMAMTHKSMRESWERLRKYNKRNVD